jgi:hypothetical protein
MADMLSGCYECSRNCINDQFCGQDGTISLPKQLKIRVIANPTFWGFNDGSGNVLTSGTAIFSNGHYDFFDGYDELHFATKQCGEDGPVQGPFRDEQRPDVLYRSVYDPDDPTSDEFSGLKHYNGATRDDIERGGAEVYLIDRSGTATSDEESCDQSDPTKVYKKFPENFGYGTKISTTDTIFKNKTGAWRYISQDACYDNIYMNSGVVSECDGSPKQEILRGDNFGSEYDPFQIRVSGERGCGQDGSIPSLYKGEASVYRSGGVQEFLHLSLTYNSGPASGIADGIALGVYGSYLDGGYRVFGVTHSSGVTDCKVVGTLGSGTVLETGHRWSALGTSDPNTCCGGAAHNISNDTKRANSIKNYHSDLGRIFNNDKNKLQANRFPENRYTYGLGTTSQINPANSFRVNKTIPDVTETGVLLESGYPVFSQEHSYYGQFFEVDKYDTSIRVEGKYNKTQGNNGTCYSKKASLSVYPDCITQYSEPFAECDGPEKQITNMISRLAIVYRGCNFDDGCTYSESGHPYFAPTGVEDLRKGLAGQEIYMYINLSNVWGPKTKPLEDCGCGDDVPPGKKDPIFVEVPSPVTFATFPKFDLYPSGYGCYDLLWQYDWASECEGAVLNECPIPSSAYACLPKQPYTTYGFIRNLCGNEYHDRREVITSAFANLVQAGDYRNTGVAPTNPQPMYWQFNNPYTLESGQVGGFSASGNYPFWGVSDSQGRVVSPYFRPKPAIAYGLGCDGPPPEYPYLDFDLCSTRANGWPTDKVPFLVEIDHTDDCVGCGSIEATQGNLMLEASGLNTTFSHARGEKYGWNHCRYKGVSFDPTYTCSSGLTIPCVGLASGIDLQASYSPYTGNTCSCMDQQFPLINIPLKNTNISAGWTTWNVNNSYVEVPGCAQDYLNDYFTPVPYQRSPGFSVYASFKLACDGAHKFLIPPDATGILKNYLMLSQVTGNQNVLDLMYMNAGCGHHYPSAASDLSLQASFVAVPSGNEQIFELIPDHLLYQLTLLGTINAPLTVLSALADNHVFGCNTYYSEYGCAGTNSYGQGGFYPCVYCAASATQVCDCPNITCNECDYVTSAIPVEYQNPCFCDCNLQLMRRTLIDFNGSRTVVYSSGISCTSSPSSGIVVAVSYSGEYSSVGPIYLNSNTQIAFSSIPVGATADSACSWHTGPNMLASGINYEYQEPYRLSSAGNGSTVCTTLMPETCIGDCANDSNAQQGSCGDPIPSSGSVSVNLRSCFPETMIVNKIECVGDTFNLYVAREYHSRARNWEKLVSLPGPPVTPSCQPKQIGAYRYAEGTGTVCIEVPFCTPSDSVTPAYYSEAVLEGTGIVSYRGVCNAHYSEGIHSSQDFILGSAPASGQDRLWNYFNLFYESGVPSNKYYPAIDLGNPAATPSPIPSNPCLNGESLSDTSIFDTGKYNVPVGRLGVDWTNKFHSCLQDHTECGSDFYCNKMFFPRRKYAVGTKVSRFGALQLCTSNSSLVLGDWYTGFQDFENDEYPDIILEAENTRFIHACDETIKTTITESVGLDDVIVSVADYLPLIGVDSSLFRYTSDIKSCTVISSGDCHILNKHSELSIRAGIHGPKTFLVDGKNSMGYYLDKTTAVSGDNCLFNPFKILVDVECCESVLRRREVPFDPPTMLEYIVDGVPSIACGGFVKPPPCSCYQSTCGGVLGYYELAPTAVCLTLAMPRGVAPTVVGSGIQTVCDTECYTCCAGPGNGDQMAFTVSEGTRYYGYNTTSDGSINYEIGDSSTPVGCKLVTPPCNRALPLAGGFQTCGGGDGFISGSTATVSAYQCGDYLYFSDLTPTGCCATKTLCEVLASSWRLRVGDCTIFSLADKADHSVEYLNNCGCLEAEQYRSCDTSLLHCTITEAV